MRLRRAIPLRGAISSGYAAYGLFHIIILLLRDQMKIGKAVFSLLLHREAVLRGIAALRAKGALRSGAPLNSPFFASF
jgi:hypothetical protein